MLATLPAAAILRSPQRCGTRIRPPNVFIKATQQKKRKRPPKPTTTDDDDDDALIAKLEEARRPQEARRRPAHRPYWNDSSSDAESRGQRKRPGALRAEDKDIYGRPTDKVGAALFKRRLNNDNTPTEVGDVLRGALNKVPILI